MAEIIDPTKDSDDPLLRSMGEWWDCYHEIVNMATESLMADAARSHGDFGLLGKAIKFVADKYSRVRRKKAQIRRGVRRAVGNFFNDTPIKAFRSGGFTITAAGSQLIPVWDKGRPLVKIRNDFTGDTLTLTDKEAESMAAFLIWFQHCGPVEHPDPASYVRESLAKQGITKENYRTHPESPGYNGLNLISYPWPDEDDAPRIITPGSLGSDG